MAVLLHFKGLAFLLELDGNAFVGAEFGLFVVRIVVVLHVHAGQIAHLSDKAALEVDQGNGRAVFVEDQHGGNTGSCSDTRVICTKRRRRVHDARTVFRGDKVARDDLEGLICVLVGKRVGKQLGIAQAHELTAGKGFQHRPGKDLAFGAAVHILVFFAEIFGNQGLRQDDALLFLGVGVKRVHQGVYNLWAHREGCVRRQRPRGGRPGHDVHGLRAKEGF